MILRIAESDRRKKASDFWHFYYDTYYVAKFIYVVMNKTGIHIPLDIPGVIWYIDDYKISYHSLNTYRCQRFY